MVGFINSKRRWCEADLKLLACMIADKTDYAQMSLKLGRSVHSIKAMISGTSGKAAYEQLKKNFSTILGEMLAKNKKSKSAATTVSYGPFNWPFSTASTTTAPLSEPIIPARHRKVWTAAEDKKLIELFDFNLKLDKIAVALGRTKFGVLGRLAYLKQIRFDKDKNAYFRTVLYYQL
mgnify:FL=1